MDNTAKIGHNNPPSPLDEALAPYGDIINEAEKWADGEPITTEAQMKDLDCLIKAVKECKKSVSMAEKSEAAPLYDAWKAKKAEFKPTLDDLDLLVQTLVASGAPFKDKLAAEKQAAKQKAWDEANAARLEAERKAREAADSDLEAQREAQSAREAALEADKVAREASKDTVKGMRPVHCYEIEDYAVVWGSIPLEEKIAIVKAWVEKNHKAKDIAGVRQWTEKQAY